MSILLHTARRMAGTAALPMSDELLDSWLAGGIPGQPDPDPPQEPVEPGVPTVPDHPPPAPVA